MYPDGRRSRWLLIDALSVVGSAVALIVIARGGTSATAPRRVVDAPLRSPQRFDNVVTGAWLTAEATK